MKKNLIYGVIAIFLILAGVIGISLVQNSNNNLPTAEDQNNDVLFTKGIEEKGEDAEIEIRLESTEYRVNEALGFTLKNNLDTQLNTSVVIEYKNKANIWNDVTSNRCGCDLSCTNSYNLGASQELSSTFKLSRCNIESKEDLLVAGEYRLSATYILGDLQVKKTFKEFKIVE